METLIQLLDIDWIQLGKLILAFIVALPIAWERERETRIMGLRTFPLVAIGSCGYVLVMLPVLGDNPDAQARIVQGLITGIGFVGGGAILKEGDHVRGTATATSIWLTGALGAAIAFGRFEIAVGLALVNYLVLRLLTPLKETISSNGDEENGAG